MPQLRIVVMGLGLLMALCACRSVEPAPADVGGAPSSTGKADDADAFDSFIAGRPTPEAFRLRYPNVALVLPGEIATKELRTDRSRFFAKLDDQKRISGGRFQ